jgi:hypothetical protein
MDITNNKNLPSIFLNYAKRNAYDSGDCDWTPSSLAESAMITHLSKVHADKLTHDVSDDIMSILGNAIHSILESGAEEGDLIEHRMFAEFDGYVISGCADRMYRDGDDWKISDYKSTSSSTIIHNPAGKREWVAQQSIYAWLASKNGMNVTDVEVVCVVRDWQMSQAAYKRASGYPEAAVIVIPLTLWSHEEVECYMRERIAALTAKEPADCTPSERWQSDTVFAVHSYTSGGGLSKRAVKGGLHTSSYDAEEYILEQSIHGEVQVRPGKPNRCADWCPVSDFCTQYQNEIGENEDGW